MAGAGNTVVGYCKLIGGTDPIGFSNSGRLLDRGAFRPSPEQNLSSAVQHGSGRMLIPPDWTHIYLKPSATGSTLLSPRSCYH